MKHITLIVFCVIAILASSCSDESIEPKSIFDTTAPARNTFDTWILNNYVKPYNIDFKYK